MSWFQEVGLRLMTLVRGCGWCCYISGIGESLVYYEAPDHESTTARFKPDLS